MKKRQIKKNDTKSTLMSGEPNVRTSGTSIAMDEKLAESRGDIIDQAQDQIDADIQEQIYQSRRPDASVAENSARKARPPAETPPGART